jgi:mono/diheme cytochrome c family protein
MRRLIQRYCAVIILLSPAALLGTDQSWKKHVSESERARVNPYANHTDAVAAGGRVFADHCAKCHGNDALGYGKRPSLRTPEVQDASDGEIFWLLRNGFVRRGMPSWSALPDATKWQVVTYLKSLGLSSEDHSENKEAAKNEQK